ncbi:hypothetical protein FAZ95_07880 [Trinickia violacea]|uniref:Uncharacterized protein n=1 Tax=Trinickia violacea TaxID=2571746 RepID=A0A4P8IQD2_9BURK|nr:hypothetical protein [Trinickia violacea]QCP49104.1 hypothetical protein FAZ95_07880 [Trinickia violacea]
MIDPGAALLSYDHACQLVRDVKGEHGVIVVGVGTAGERGFQMLYRFSGVCDRLEAHGINVIFVYPKASARHVFDATSVRGVRYRGKTCLFLDGDGRLFRNPVKPRALHAVYLDADMRQVGILEVTLDSETWDEQLRGFLLMLSDGACTRPVHSGRL